MADSRIRTSLKSNPNRVCVWAAGRRRPPASRVCSMKISKTNPFAKLRVSEIVLQVENPQAGERESAGDEGDRAGQDGEREFSLCVSTVKEVDYSLFT